MNRRQRALWLLIAVACLLLALALAGLLLPDPATDFSAKNQPPSLRHPFGTDWVGRDMLVRTVKGLSTSMLVGIVASAVSAVLAAIVGTAVISAFYLMIMYFNDNRFTPGEFAGMAACAAVIAALSAVLYGVYRLTRRSVCRQLGIRPGR